MLKVVVGISYIMTFFWCIGCRTKTDHQPNIVFILSDDHACQAISAYGSKINQTPNIDRIAREGVIFSNNFCANSICAPSRASILSGKHSHMNGLLTNRDTFNGKQQTFPKLLKKHGYTTAIFGKWHLKSQPTGFDEWMVYPGQGHYYNPDYNTPEGRKQIIGYAVEITTDLALAFMNRQRVHAKPFLVMCQYKAPHRTWNPGSNYLYKYDDETIPEPITLFDDYSGRAAPASLHEMGIDKHLRMGPDLKIPYTACNDWQRMTGEQQRIFAQAYEDKNNIFQQSQLMGKELVRWKYQRYIKDYLRCIAAVDDNVGRILNFLNETGLEDNTLVIYSSDQGFYLGEHGWFDKRWMYEESLRMPLLMRWPGVIKAGSEINALTQNIDFASTFLTAAGIAVPDSMQGMSLLPFLKGEKPKKWRSSIYYHYYEFPGEHNVAKHYGVRTDHYKLIYYYEHDEWELFDLKKDPQEMHSVYNQTGYEETVNNLKMELDRLRILYQVPEDTSGTTDIGVVQPGQ
jgi:arylsulfatase A-like enzyme